MSDELITPEFDVFCRLQALGLPIVQEIHHQGKGTRRIVVAVNEHRLADVLRLVELLEARAGRREVVHADEAD